MENSSEPTTHELMALTFLEGGPHTMAPVIDSEEELSAALMFNRLKERGLAVCQVGDCTTRGPTYSLTQKGRGFLAMLTPEQRAAALAYRGDDTIGAEEPEL